VLVEEGAKARLTAVGVVSPGIVLPDRILLAPNVPGWERLRLRDLIAAGLDSPLVDSVPISVGTDAKAAALAEWKWGALAGKGPGHDLIGTRRRVGVQPASGQQVPVEPSA
jgi:glucokinase